MKKIQHPYAGIQTELSGEMGDASAPAPPYMQTDNVTLVQPSNSGVQMMGEPQMLNFQAIPTNLNPPVGPESTQLRCPQCKCTVKTNVRYRATAKTHLACLLLSWTW